MLNIINLFGKKKDKPGQRVDTGQGSDSQEALRRNEEFFRLITENSSDIVLIVDSKGNIKYASQSVYRFLGYSPEELVGKSGFGFIFPADLPRAVLEFGAAIGAGHKPVLHSFRVMHKNGSVRFFEGIGKNLLNNPVISGFVMNVRDITERNKSEESLRESEERNRLITDNTSDLISLLSFEALPKYLYLSPSHERTMGYKVDELIGKSGLEFVHPEDKVKLASLIKVYAIEKARRIVGAASKPWHETFEYRAQTKSGEWVYLESKADLVGDKIIIVSRDVSVHKKAEELLKEEKEKAQKYLDVAGVILVILDTRGNISLLNKRGCEILGIDEEKQIIAKNWFDNFVPDNERRTVKRAFENLMAGETALTEYFENSVVAKNGKERIIAWFNVLLRDKDNQITGVLSSGEDITGRVKAESALKEAYAMLKETQEQLIQAEKMEAIARLASGVAHEVKNPLGVILQGLDYLEDKLSPAQKNVSEVLTMMKKGINKADTIIGALVDFSRATHLDAHTERVNVILENSLALVRYAVDAGKIHIVKGLKEDLPLVSVDRGKIEQVFMNVLLNAIQATPTGGKLSISSYKANVGKTGAGVGRRRGDYFEPEEEAVFVEIKDTGSGISKDNLKKVFEPFFTTKEASGGTGLGLSVSRNIIDMHRGIIEIGSEEVKWTKVTLIFKIAQGG